MISCGWLTNASKGEGKRERDTGVGANSTAAARASADAFQFPAKVRARTRPWFPASVRPHNTFWRSSTHPSPCVALRTATSTARPFIVDMAAPSSLAAAKTCANFFSRSPLHTRATIRPRTDTPTHESLRWAACPSGRAACEWSRRAAGPDEGRLLLEEALGDQLIAHCLCEIARAPACVYGPHLPVAKQE
jgi:hypothetical protein